MNQKNLQHIALLFLRAKGKRTAWNFDFPMRDKNARKMAQAIDVPLDEFREFLVAIRSKRARMPQERQAEIAYLYVLHMFSVTSRAVGRIIDEVKEGGKEGMKLAGVPEQQSSEFMARMLIKVLEKHFIPRDPFF